MAVVAVVNDSVQIHDMGDTAGDAETGISSLGGGGQAGENEDFVYQGDRSIGRKAGTTLVGLQVDASTTGGPVDHSASDRRLWMFKGGQSNSGVLLDIGSPAMEVRIGSGSGDYFTIDVAGNDTYPVKGGYLIIPINANETAYAHSANQTGTPDLAAVDYCAIRSDSSSTSKGENLYMDSLDFGIGLTLVGGDGADPDGTWQDFVDDDEGAAGPTHRFGFFSTLEGIIFVLGDNWIGRNESGTTTATVFNDATGKTLVFPDGLFAAGDSRIQIDLGNSSTDIDWGGHTFNSNGSGYRKEFDTETEIDEASDEARNADLTALVTNGDYVLVNDIGGAETPGLTDGTNYWVGKTTTGITFHTGSRNDALTGTSPVALTASSASNGERWLVSKVLDTRTQLVVTSATGAFDADSCTFSDFSTITLTATCTLTGCLFKRTGGVLTMIDGTSITDTTFENHDTIDGEAFITCPDVRDISDCPFDNTGGTGHAIENTEGGNISRSWVGINFTGYFSVTDQTLHLFNNTTDVSTANDEIALLNGHGYVTGDAVVYSATLTANTDLTNLTEDDVIYINNDGDVDLMTLHSNRGDAINDNNPINLTAGTGNETHALWPANAAFFNNSDSAGELELLLTGGGDIPSVRNGLDATTLVTASVTLSITNIETDSEVRIINLDDIVNFNKELSGSDQISGIVLAAEISDGGTGYTNGTQTLTVVGGTGAAAQIEVTVSGGIVTSINSITVAGSYTANPPTPATTSGGGGTGCTLRLTIAGTHDFSYNATLGVNVAVIIFHINFKDVRIEQVLPTVDSTILVQQSTDRVFIT